MKEYLDCHGNPLEIGHEYRLVSYDENAFEPAHPDLWLYAVWDGEDLLDVFSKESLNAWLEPRGMVSPDVIY